MLRTTARLESGQSARTSSAVHARHCISLRVIGEKIPCCAGDDDDARRGGRAKEREERLSERESAEEVRPKSDVCLEAEGGTVSGSFERVDRPDVKKLDACVDSRGVGNETG